MPTMGGPSITSNSDFSGISIGEKKPVPNNLNIDKSNGKSKEEILNKLAGAKEKSIFKDGGKHNQMGKDEFLKLLSHQMQNQDPMNPMEQSKFVGELAQFAQLEQMTGLNQKFEKMSGNATTESKFYGASFLGRGVMTAGSSLNLKGEGASSDVHFTLDKEASKVMVRIFDKKHNMIGEISQDNMTRGNQTLTWNGTSLDNTPAPKGDYTVQIIAYDKQLQEFPVQSKVSGVVTGVSFEDGETVLTVDNGKKIFLRDADSFATDVTKLNAQEVKKSPAPNALQVANAYKQNQPEVKLLENLGDEVSPEIGSPEEVANYGE